MKTFALVGAIVAILAPGLVQAQDALRWQGPYLGLNGLASWGDYSAGGGHSNLDTRGNGLGLYAGYNHAIGASGILGAEMNFQIGAAGVGTQRGFPWLENLAALRLRGGYALPRAMIYAGVGVTQADLELKGRTLGVNGPQLFLGVEVPLSDRLTARLEYSITVMPLPGPPVFDADEDVMTRMLHLGVAYRF